MAHEPIDFRAYVLGWGRGGVQRSLSKLNVSLVTFKSSLLAASNLWGFVDLMPAASLVTLAAAAAARPEAEADSEAAAGAAFELGTMLESSPEVSATATPNELLELL